MKYVALLLGLCVQIVAQSIPSPSPNNAGNVRLEFRGLYPGMTRKERVDRLRIVGGVEPRCTVGVDDFCEADGTFLFFFKDRVRSIVRHFSYQDEYLDYGLSYTKKYGPYRAEELTYRNGIGNSITGLAFTWNDRYGTKLKIQQFCGDLHKSCMSLSNPAFNEEEKEPEI